MDVEVEEISELKLTSILKQPIKNEEEANNLTNGNNKKNKKTKQKATKWDRLSRTKPNHLDRDRERGLVVAATKGVVQLFNAIKEHQTGVKIQMAEAKSVRKTEKTLKTLKKDRFFDKLNPTSKKESRLKKKDHVKNEPQVKEELQQQNESKQHAKKWNVLSNDYLTLAESEETVVNSSTIDDGSKIEELDDEEI